MADAGLTLVALWLASDLRQRLPFGPTLGVEGWAGPQVYLLALALSVIVYAAMGVYRPERLRSIGGEIRTVSKATVVGITLLAGLLYFMDRGVSRWLFAYYGVAKIGLVVTARIAAHSLCRGWHLPLAPPRRTLIVGSGTMGQNAADRLRQADGARYRVIGYVDHASGGSTAPDGLPILGTLDQAEAIVREQKVDELLVALPLCESHALAGLMTAIQDLPIEVKVIPDYFDLAYLYARSDELAGMPVIKLKEPVLTPPQRAAKRAFDLVMGGLLLVVVFPFLAIAGLAIKLDSPGPMVYRQKRIGEGGRVFWMYKLRTMVVDADRHEPRLIEHDGDSLQFNKRPDDPRVTRVGAWLRRWSIDELPQLWNVIRGDLSLVGPRPELPSLVERYATWQRKRFAVPQGVTGWWQVNGRPQDVNEKVEYDLYYARNYSVGLDVWILLKTVGAVIGRDGAF